MITEPIGPLGRAARRLAGGLSIWILVAFYIPPLLEGSHPPGVFSVIPVGLAVASQWFSFLLLFGSLVIGLCVR